MDRGGGAALIGKVGVEMDSSRLEATRLRWVGGPDVTLFIPLLLEVVLHALGIRASKDIHRLTQPEMTVQYLRRVKL